MQANTPLPWYRQFWPWFIISIPATSVVVGIFLLWLAGQGELALVDENYYQSGLNINQRLVRDRFAREANLQANLLIPADQTQTSVYLLDSIAAPASLQLNLASAKDSSRDRNVILMRVNGQLYQGPAQTLVPGRYSIELLDNAGQWRLAGKADFPSESPVKLGNFSLD